MRKTVLYSKGITVTLFTGSEGRPMVQVAIDMNAGQMEIADWHLWLKEAYLASFDVELRAIGEDIPSGA